MAKTSLNKKTKNNYSKNELKAAMNSSETCFNTICNECIFSVASAKTICKYCHNNTKK